MNGIPDCSECIHFDKNPMDNPCFHCLDGYNGRPDFKKKPSKIEENGSFTMVSDVKKE